jgi:DNA-binding beta-propeller fold protein YncE
VRRNRIMDDRTDRVRYRTEDAGSGPWQDGGPKASSFRTIARRGRDVVGKPKQDDPLAGSATRASGALRFRRPLLISLALIAITLVVAGVGCVDTPDDGSPPAEPDHPRHGTVVRIDPDSGEIQDVYDVGGDPLLLAVASGRVWVMNFVEGTLSRIDPSAEHATSVRLEGQTAAMTSDGREIWVAHDGNALSRLDGATGKSLATFRLASERLFELRDAGFLEAVGNSVWVTIPDLDDAQAPQELWRLDASTGIVLDRMQIGGNPSPPLVDGRYAWIASLVNVDLTRIDLRTGQIAKLPAVTFPYTVTAGDGSIWVGTAVPPQVVRIDPRSTDVLARILVDGDVRGVGFEAGAVWATTEGGVTRIDPSTNQVVRTIPLGSYESDTGPTAVGFLDGSIWVSIE